MSRTAPLCFFSHRGKPVAPLTDAMLDEVRSTIESTYATVRDLVEEAVEAVEEALAEDPPPESSESPRPSGTIGPPAPPAPPMEVRASARARHANDAGVLATRRQIEALLEPKGDTLAIPPRPEDAPTGREFMRSIEGLGPKAREAAVLAEIRRGNVPSFQRRLQEVELTDGDHTATVRVMPDYLAVGSDEDYVRVPMTPATAQALADDFGARLPTKRVVDAVWDQADVRLSPHALSSKREATGTFLHHDDLIASQLREKDARLGALVAGHKKDVVNTRRLEQRRGRVAIYGWHLPDGSPIQPLSTVHHDGYVDYSHGVRLMADEMIVDGRRMTVDEVLRDPELSGLLSHEGVMDGRLP